ncbi:hypothetical protein [Nocardia sp. NPDC003963]
MRIGLDPRDLGIGEPTGLGAPALAIGEESARSFRAEAPQALVEFGHERYGQIAGAVSPGEHAGIQVAGPLTVAEKQFRMRLIPDQCHPVERFVDEQTRFQRALCPGAQPQFGRSAVDDVGSRVEVGIGLREMVCALFVGVPHVWRCSIAEFVTHPTHLRGRGVRRFLQPPDLGQDLLPHELRENGTGLHSPPRPSGLPAPGSIRVCGTTGPGVRDRVSVGGDPRCHGANVGAVALHLRFDLNFC